MQLDETQNLQEENAFWGSDDTLYVWFSEQTGEENVPYWIAAYTPESGTLRLSKSVPEYFRVTFKQMRGIILEIFTKMKRG